MSAARSAPARRAGMLAAVPPAALSPAERVRAAIDAGFRTWTAVGQAAGMTRQQATRIARHPDRQWTLAAKETPPVRETIVMFRTRQTAKDALEDMARTRGVTLSELVRGYVAAGLARDLARFSAMEQRGAPHRR